MCLRDYGARHQFMGGRGGGIVLLTGLQAHACTAKCPPVAVIIHCQWTQPPPPPLCPGPTRAQHPPACLLCPSAPCSFH
jgi:hypothetical protein